MCPGMISPLSVQGAPGPQGDPGGAAVAEATFPPAAVLHISLNFLLFIYLFS